MPSLHLLLFLVHFMFSGHLPLDLPALNPVDDYYKGLEKAKAESKPIFLLFTGTKCEHNLANKDLIEQDKTLRRKLDPHFVYIRLNVDDLRPLETNETVFSSFFNKETVLRTLGNKWAHLETERFNSNIQPLAVIINGAEQILVEPIIFDFEKNHLDGYLQKGLKAFSR